MSVSNSFSSGTTISSSEMNANFTDFASEVTNSLPRDGQAAMTGQLKITAGTAAAPALIFSTDTDCGIFRAAADTIGVAGTLQTSAGEDYDAFPAGTSMLFYDATAPTGWTAESINDKALRVVSSGSTGGTDGGTTAFSSVLTSRTIAQANLPNVNLTAASDGAHTHNLGTLFTGTVTASVQSGGSFGAVPYNTTQNNNTQSDGAHTHTVPLGGSGTAMDFAVQYSDVIIATKD